MRDQDRVFSETTGRSLGPNPPPGFGVPEKRPKVRNREHPMWDEWTDHGRFYKIRTAANILTVVIQVLIVARLT